jgi:hypothetical protein
MCTTCNERIKYDKNHIEDRVSHHIKTAKHQRRVDKIETGKQQFITTSIQNALINERKNEYFMDMTKAFLSADIALHKLNNLELKSFLEKWTKKTQPNPQTLRTYYISDVYQKTIDKIRENIGENDFYLIVDETQNVCQKYVVNILIGSLDGKFSKPMLIKCQEIENAKHSAILQAINNALTKAFPNGIDYEKFRLLVTDQAKVMLKVGIVLKETYPNLNHITCIVHALHRVCEKIREGNHLVDKFISLMKKVLRKSCLQATIVQKYHWTSIASKYCNYTLGYMDQNSNILFV